MAINYISESSREQASFIFDLHRKDLFLNFAARKSNLFSTPDLYGVYTDV
jgi:hypothetical protein